MRNSRSPKRHSKYELAPEDLCIKLEVLADRLEVLENDNKALKDAVKELQQWKSWLWKLYHWLHRFSVRHQSGQMPPQKGTRWILFKQTLCMHLTSSIGFAQKGVCAIALGCEIVCIRLWFSSWPRTGCNAIRGPEVFIYIYIYIYTHTYIYIYRTILCLQRFDVSSNP